MKKILLYILTATMIIALSSCKSNTENNNNIVIADEPITASDNPEKEEAIEVQYGDSSADYQMWSSAESLVESKYADFVVTAKVTGISFQVVDKKTGLTPEENAFEKYCENYDFEIEPWLVFELITLYDIDVITTYKGKENAFSQIRVWGGLKDVYVDEQLAATKKYNLEFITIEEKPVELKIGDFHLFVLNQFKDLPPNLLNLDQCVYNLSNPFEKYGIGERYDSPTNYYSLNKDENGRTIISAKDVISSFGDDKWEAFWTDWQRDNPDWEKRLDQAAVEKALGE